MELGHYKEGTIPAALFDQTARQIANYVVSLSVDARPSGSATLVTVGKRYGMLTASHVVDDLQSSKDGIVAIVCAEHIHQLLVNIRNLNIQSFNRASKSNLSGPDLAFIQLPEPNPVGILKAKKSFYPLSSRKCEVFDAMKDKREGIYFIMGAPAEMTISEGERGTSSHIVGSVHFAGRAQLSEQIEETGFDYLRMITFAGVHGFPENFGGVSGGGVWHTPFSMDPDVGNTTLKIERPELIGVAYYQSDFKDSSRTITCHGPKSIYEAIVAKIEARS